jgi:hypothetical protein
MVSYKAKRTRELNWDSLRLKGAIRNLENLIIHYGLYQTDRGFLAAVESSLEEGIKKQRNELNSEDTLK